MRIVFTGTPDLAVPTLDALLASSHEVVLVVTQPDRPAGRGRKMIAPPVKDAALFHGAPVFQPESINRPEVVARLRAVEPDAIVAFAYGKRFTRRILAIPRLGCFNIHASLLPKYRGAAPINHAILNGETETGVTVQRMAPEIDTGAILAQKKCPIGPRETAGDLSERLARLAAEIIAPTLDAVERGTVVEVPQDDAQATEAPSLTKEDGAIPWDRPARAVCNFVRGMTPWPGAFTFRHRAEAGEGERLIVLSARPAEGDIPAGGPGEVVLASSRLLVATGLGGVVVEAVKPAGSRAMDASAYLRGHAVQVGDQFLARP